MVISNKLLTGHLWAPLDAGLRFPMAGHECCCSGRRRSKDFRIAAGHMGGPGGGAWSGRGIQDRVIGQVLFIVYDLKLINQAILY